MGKAKGNGVHGAHMPTAPVMLGIINAYPYQHRVQMQQSCGSNRKTPGWMGRTSALACWNECAGLVGCDKRVQDEAKVCHVEEKKWNEVLTALVVVIAGGSGASRRECLGARQRAQSPAPVASSFSAAGDGGLGCGVAV